MNYFITLEVLKTWGGLTLAVYTVVAVWKSFFKRKLENTVIRAMAFSVALMLLLFVAVADGAFISPWYATANWLTLGFAILNAFGMVIATAGVHKLYKDSQGEPLEPLYPEEPAAPSDTEQSLEAVKAATTAPSD